MVVVQSFFICLYPEHVDMVIYASSRNGAGRQILNRVGFCPCIFVAAAIVRIYCRSATVNYQKKKYRCLNAGEPLKDTIKMALVLNWFRKYVRNPNYSAEQTIWILFYCFIVGTGKWLNWSAAGFVLFALLFRGAQTLEKISAAKYPDYKDYQKHGQVSSQIR